MSSAKNSEMDFFRFGSYAAAAAGSAMNYHNYYGNHHQNYITGQYPHFPSTAATAAGLTAAAGFFTPTAGTA